MYGKDWEYARTRLLGTVVRLGDVPVRVEDVGPRRVLCSRFSDGVGVETTLDELNVKPMPLGFVNYDGEVSYVSRIPKRNDWRQGFRFNNVRTTFGYPADVLSPSSLVRMMTNRYPTFESALSFVRKNGSPRAWHRHWAIGRDESLLYKGGNVVGAVVAGKPSLHEEHQYLREYLQECI